MSSTTRLRPRCRIIAKHPKDKVLEMIRINLENSDYPLEGQVVQEHAFVRFPEDKQHYWSPELHIWARQQDDETIVYGVIGPKPKIWTMFVFFYTVVLTLAFFGGSYGLIQLWLGMPAPFLWSLPAGLAALTIVFLGARYGQTRGKEQMQILFGFLYDSVEAQESKSTS